MFRVKYHYPGDPVTDVTLMFGGEFAQANPNREIVVLGGGTEQHIPVEDIICDSCNANIFLADPCAETDRRLYCWACYSEWIKPHLAIGEGMVVMKVDAK